MRRAVLPALALLSVLLLPAAAQAGIPHLVSDYHLEQGTDGDQVSGLPDSSGNGLNGAQWYTATCFAGNASGPSPCQEPAKFGHAFGVGAASSGGTSMLAGGGVQTRLTALAWVKAPTSPGTHRYILAEGYTDSCGSPAYGLYTGSNGGLVFFVHAGSPAGDFFTPSAAPGAVWDGHWHLVAGTYDGTTARLYLDGTEVGSGVNVGHPIAYTQPHLALTIASYGTVNNTQCGGDSFPTGLNGFIDEVRIYDDILTHGEIARLAQAPASSDPAGPALQLDPVTVHVTSVDQIAQSSFRINGTISDAGAPTGYHVRFRIPGHADQFFPADSTQSAGTSAGIREGTQPISVTVNAGVDPGTDYEATIEAGATNGGYASFRTLDGTVVRQATASMTAGESAGTITLDVQRAGTVTGTSTVDYATADGTATAGADYTAMSGTLTFAPGETAKQIAVPVLNDAAVEGDETFAVTLSNHAGATGGEPRTTTVTITDDDQPVHLAGATAQVVEAHGPATLTVERPGDVSLPVSVGFATADGTARAGADYTATDGTLDFAPGEHTKTISVPIADDDIHEIDETFAVSLTGGSPAVGDPSTAVVTIADDDPPLVCPAAGPTHPPAGLRVRDLEFCIYGSVVAGRADHRRMLTSLASVRDRLEALIPPTHNAGSRVGTVADKLRAANADLGQISGGVKSIFDAVRLHGAYVANIFGLIAAKLHITL